MSFKIGAQVQVGTSTKRFPIPTRYEGRFGVVTDRRIQGNSTVYDVTFWPRRVQPLTVTQSQIINVAK